MNHTPNGIPILELPEIGSTNAEALRLGLAGAAAPLWVRADRQTAGRGRSGRAWTSEPGNHYASLLLRLQCPPAVLHQLSFVAAVAVVAAIRAVAVGQVRLNLQLKWPNDVLVDGAKLVGILSESTQMGASGLLAAVGIGINLAHAPGDIGRPTARLADFGLSVSPRAMLDALAPAMSATLATWDDGRGFQKIRSAWLRDAAPPGTPISVHAGNERVEGTFAGLDADGALILRDHSGYDRRMTFGDVIENRAVRDQGQ